jgi:hypothetical protein
MKREEATETPAPTPGRLTTLSVTVVAVIGSFSWTFGHVGVFVRASAVGMDEGPMGSADDVD